MVSIMLEFKILCEGFFTKENVKVIYNHNDTMPKDDKINIFIENKWDFKLNELREKGVIIFNGKLFRLSNCRIVQNKLEIELGNTDYKEYVATRMEDFYNYHSLNNLANPLAVCIAMISSDKKIVVEKREGVDVYSGRYHVIGGFIDRDIDFKLNLTPCPFKAIKREVKEETGVDLEDSVIYSLGVVYDLVSPHPEMCFLVNLSISSKEILDVFLTSKHDFEVHDIELIHDSESELSNFIFYNHGNISATGEPCLLLYGKYKYGESWYKDIVQKII